jgi:hypothetical protein
MIPTPTTFDSAAAIRSYVQIVDAFRQHSSSFAYVKPGLVPTCNRAMSSCSTTSEFGVRVDGRLSRAPRSTSNRVHRSAMKRVIE